MTVRELEGHCSSRLRHVPTRFLTLALGERALESFYREVHPNQPIDQPAPKRFRSPNGVKVTYSARLNPSRDELTVDDGYFKWQEGEDEKRYARIELEGNEVVKPKSTTVHKEHPSASTMLGGLIILAMVVWLGSKLFNWLFFS